MARYFFWMKFDLTTIMQADGDGGKEPAGASAAKVMIAGTIRHGSSAGDSVTWAGTIRNGRRPDGSFDTFAGTIRQRAQVAQASGEVSFNVLTNDAFSFYVEKPGEQARLFSDEASAWKAVTDPDWVRWCGNKTQPVVLTSIDIV